MSEFQTYNVKFPTDVVAQTVSRIDHATHDLDRDLVIAALIVYMLWLSDPDITKDAERLTVAIDSMSKHLCFVIAMPITVDPKKAN